MKVSLQARLHKHIILHYRLHKHVILDKMNFPKKVLIDTCNSKYQQ